MRDAVRRIPPSGAVFYIGVTSQSARWRWDADFGHGARVHSERFARMHVVLRGTGRQIADRETDAVEEHRHDDRCVNAGRGGTGMPLDAPHALLYICIGYPE